jgi:transposase
MRQASKRIPESAEKTVRDIRRATRRHHSAEEKIRIVLEGLRGEDSIAELCRKEGINQNLYYRWSKEFLEAGKKRLAGDTAREATSDEVKELKAEARQLKETLAEVLIEARQSIRRPAIDEPDHRHRRRLRARHNRPRSRRAAEQRDELAAVGHSITSSARASRVGGTWGERPERLSQLLGASGANGS